VNVPVLLWHGADDVFTPIGHTYWMAKQVPGSVLEVQSGAAHFGAMEILPRVLAWTKDGRGSERLRVQGAHQPAFSA
jgi:pimeloyl-ACP methyl ester carboxylesterase